MLRGLRFCAVVLHLGIVSQICGIIVFKTLYKQDGMTVALKGVWNVRLHSFHFIMFIVHERLFRKFIFDKSFGLKSKTADGICQSI